jgi:ribulose-5-phosphate 4-epimerase/fuculose-1-phosphate aldolase
VADQTDPRVQLAALFRVAALHDFHEGIDNHCSLAIGQNRFLLNRYGPHWSELRASDLLEVDGDGNVIGDGEPESTAFHIHAQAHAAHPEAHCVIHTHMPYATAIACTHHGFETRLSQNSMRFHGRVAVLETYAGRALDPAEGARIASAVAAGARVVFMANHGVMVVGETVAKAWYDLYFLERACQTQVLAATFGLAEQARVGKKLAQQTAEQFDVERDEHGGTLWDAMLRRLDRELPGYGD